MGIILKENNLVYTRMNHEKFLGSSCWRFDIESNSVIKKERHFEKTTKKESQNELSDDIVFFDSFDDADIEGFLYSKEREEAEKKLNASLTQKRTKKTEYILNKKKVREKCTAFFGLKSSVKFLAFYSISYHQYLDDNSIMKSFNTFLTRCRKDFRLKSYLWVAERQKNGTLHFHLLTNSFMPIRRVNYYMARTIKNIIEKNNIDVAFDYKRYNGVDVKRCDNNRKRLSQYLTKYISKNDIVFFRLPYHSSRDISQLFTAEIFKSFNDPNFKFIKDNLKHIQTLVIDNEYATVEYLSVEYLSVKQSNGKYFTPPNCWYWLLNKINDLIFYNYHSSIDLDKLPLC